MESEPSSDGHGQAAWVAWALGANSSDSMKPAFVVIGFLILGAPVSAQLPEPHAPRAVPSWLSVSMSLTPLRADAQPLRPPVFSPSHNLFLPSPKREPTKWEGIDDAERLNLEKQRRRHEMFQEQLRSPGRERRNDLVPVGQDDLAG